MNDLPRAAAPAPSSAAPARPPQHPLVELTRARLLEFVRDPGALFWVFGFPLILAVALGVAFRTKPPALTPIAIVQSATPWAAAVLQRSEGFDVALLDGEAAARALRK